MPFGLKDKDIKQITDVFRLHNKVEEVLIFGSRAMGTERPGSDIDLAVKGEGITVANILKIRTQLDELPIAYECDVVGYHTLKVPEFKKHIDEHGVLFYQRKEKPSEWKTYKLGDITEKIGSGATPRGGKEAYLKEGNYSLVRSQNVLDFFFSKNGLAYISEKQATELRNVTIQESDILLNITGDSVARVCQIPKKVLPARVNQHVAIIRGKKNIIDQSFLKYYLLEPSFKRYMLGLASSGATRNALTKTMIEGLEIQVPDLTTQKEIAQILSSLDDKIELLQQMNLTLENIAQAIFKEWFVDFNFPGFDGKLVDGLPKGWRMGQLGDEFNITMGQSPKGETLNQQNEGMIFYQGRTDFGFRFPSNRIYTTKPNRIANKLNTLVSVRAPVGDINMAIEKCCIGRGLSAVIHKSNAYSYTYYSMKNIELIFKGFESEGTVFGSLNKNNFENIELVVPSKELIKEFEKVTNPIDEKILNNSIQIQTLTQTRDTMLPKLMSGELEIKN